MRKKKQHQVKASWYYVFWTIMALSVVAVQIYVSTGYIELSESNHQLREGLFLLERERRLEFRHTREGMPLPHHLNSNEKCTRSKFRSDLMFSFQHFNLKGVKKSLSKSSQKFYGQT